MTVLEAAVATGADVGGLHLRVYDVTGTRLLSVIPELQQATVQDERNNTGSLSVSLPLSSPGVRELATAPAAMIEFWEGQQRVATFVYDEDSDDDADVNGPDAILTVSAPGTLQLCDWVSIYPSGGFDGPNYQDFVQMTPGAILLEVLAQGQARGTLDGTNGPHVTCSFSETHDSDGMQWPSTVWVRYDAAKSMLDVVNDLTQRGYCDVRMDGYELNAWAGGSMPDPATSPVDPAVTNDAQGWQADAGCVVARDPAELPPVPGVTASLKLTCEVPALAPLQAAVANAQAALDNANAKLTADWLAFNAYAKQHHLKWWTPAQYAVIGADQRAVADQQKALADAQSALTQAENAMPSTDMNVASVMWWPVNGGEQYDAGAWFAAEAVGRVVAFELQFFDAAGQWVTTSIVGSTTDSPSGWSAVAGTITAPADATSAYMGAWVYAANQDEHHWVAHASLSPAKASTFRADLPDVVLHRPDYVPTAPRRRQRAGIRTALLGIGEGNVSLEAADRDAIALYGRREGGASQGGVTDYPTLQRLTQLSLDQAKKPALGWTVTYVRNTTDPDEPPPPQPWRDFFCGNLVRADWIRWPQVDPTSTSEALYPVRVSSITAQYDATGVATAELELADVFEDEDVKIARQITGLLMGSSSANPLGAQPVVVDTTPPKPVDAVFTGSSTILKPDGGYETDATITWPAVTENVDGTVFDDLGWYAVDYRVGDYADPSAGWQSGLTTQNLEVGVGQLPPGATFQARVLPIDYNGNYPTNADGSPAYAYSAPAALLNDLQGPGAPSAPTVTPLPGGLAVSWNGRDTANAAMPPDYTKVEVHVSTVSQFTPTTATLADTIPGTPAAASSATTTITTPRLAYSTDYYVRLVAVDSAGNKSNPGAQAGPVRIRLIGPTDLDPTVLTNTDHSAMLNGDTGFTTGGAVVADAAARDGNARSLGANATAAGTNYTTLKPGRYRVTAVVSTTVASATPAAAVGTLDVAGTGIQSDGARPITTTDVSSTTGYRTVSMRFTVTAAVNALDVRVTCSAGTLKLSHAYVEPVMSIAVAEIRDAMVADLSATKLTAGQLTADVIVAMDANGKPGRIRIGMVDANGVLNQPGFQIGADGLRGQATGGLTTFLVDPTTGAVTVVGSIAVGSTLPQSVYGSNLVANASFEDMAVGTQPMQAGQLPLCWTDAWETVGPTSSAYADTGTVLAGSQSLTITNGDNASGRSVMSKPFAVNPGERLQIAAQLKNQGIGQPVYVRIMYGTTTTFTRQQVIANVPPTPDGCVLLNLDGTVAQMLTGFAFAGGADVMSGVVPPVLGNVYKASGSTVVPAGAKWARMCLYSWSRGGATAGTGYVTLDNIEVRRALDGSYLSSGTITGPLIRTAAAGMRLEISGQPSGWFGASVNFYQAAAGMAPARLFTTDYNAAYGAYAPNIGMSTPDTTDATGHRQSGMVMDPNTVQFFMNHTTGAYRASFMAKDTVTDPTGYVYLNASDGAAANPTTMQVTVSKDGCSIGGQAGWTFQVKNAVATQEIDFAGGSLVAWWQNNNAGFAGNNGAGVQMSAVNEIRITNWQFNSYLPVRASSFPTPTSLSLHKHAIEHLPRGYALDAVRYAPAKAWRYRHPDDYPDRKPGDVLGSYDQALHVFPMHEDLPSEVWHTDDAPDLLDVTGMLWHAVHELAGEFEAHLASCQGEKR